jgi:hypothetical protein
MSTKANGNLLKDPATWGVDTDGPDQQSALTSRLRSRARVTMPGSRPERTEPADEPAAAAATATMVADDAVRIGDRFEEPTHVSDEQVAAAAGPATEVFPKIDLAPVVAAVKSRVRLLAWSAALLFVLLFGVGVSAAANWEVGAGAALVLLALSGFVKAGVEHLAGAVIRQAPWWTALVAGFVGTFVLCSVGTPMFQTATAVGVFASLLCVALLYCYVRMRPVTVVIREETEES